MRAREYVAWGVSIGMILVMFTLKATTRGPTADAPGEATASVFGVVVDRVVIPADPNGRLDLPTARIMQGLLATIIGGALASGILGGLIGLAVGRSRQTNKPAEPGALPGTIHE